MTRFGALLAVAYPFLVLAGLRLLEPRWLVLVAAVLLGVRALLSRRAPAPEERRRLALPVVLVALLLALGWLWNDRRFLMLLPACISLALLVAFARTLHSGPTMVEIFARMQRGELSAARVRHCRETTWVWCGFFLANAGVCAALAGFAEPTTWALYTGFVAYVLMGLLFAGEFVVRVRRFGDERAPALLRRLLAGGRAP